MDRFGTATVISWTIAHGKDREGSPTRAGLAIAGLRSVGVLI